MESSVAPLPHRRSHLPSRSYTWLHLGSSFFDREPRFSPATPAVLQELVLRTEIAQVSTEETCKPGEICPNEKPPENISVLEPISDRGFGESRAEQVETISVEKSLMLGGVFDGIDLQDASVGSLQKDFFDDFEIIIDNSEDFVPESCVNLFESLDVNDYDDDGIAKQPLDLVHNAAEIPITATELQEDTIEGDKMVNEIIGCKADEVPKSVESNEVISSEVLETYIETLQREIELEKPVNSTQVLADSLSRIVEDDDVEEGEISGDDNDDMLVGDDLPDKSQEQSNVSQEVFNKRGEGAGNSHHTSLKNFTSSTTCVDENGQQQIGKKLGVMVSDVDNQAKTSDQTFDKEEKLDLGTCIKKRSGRSAEAKARKKAKFRKKRAQERIALGVKKLKLKPVAPKPKPIKYCRHYLKGRCHEGENCKFSHDITPETKSTPCGHFATQSCMKGDDCPYDHELSKYPCKNFITKGFCYRGDNCLFSHKGAPQSASDTPSTNVTASSTNIAAASFSPQKTNKQTVREAIARLPTIQARVSNPVAGLKPSSSLQSNQRNSSDASSPKINEHVTPSLRKPSVAPKGMSFLSSDKTSQDDTAKPALGSKQNTENSDNQQSLNPEEPHNKIVTNSHIQSSLNSAMKLAAELESTKRKINDSAVAVNKKGKGDVTVNRSVARNSGNISSKILEFLSSFNNK